MNRKAPALLIISEFSIYLIFAFIIKTGFVDGIFSGYQWAQGASLAAVSLTILFIIFLKHNKPQKLMSFRTLLILYSVITFAIHLNYPPESRSSVYYFYTLHIFYPVFLYLCALSGKFNIFIFSISICIIGESIATLARLSSLNSGLKDFALQTYKVLPVISKVAGIDFIIFIMSFFREQAHRKQIRRISESNPSDRNSPAAEKTKTAAHIPPQTEIFRAEYKPENIDNNIKTEDDLLSTVTFFMSKNFKAYSSLAFIFIPQSQSFILNSVRSKSVSINKNAVFQIGNSIVGKTGQEKKSFMSGDISNYNFDLSYYTNNEMINSVLSTPIISEKKELLGVLLVDSRDKHAFSDQQKETLIKFSSLAAALITNVRMRILQERASRNFKIFYEASQLFSATFNPNHIIDILFKMTAMVTDYYRLAAVTIDRNQNLASIYKIEGEKAELREGISFNINEGLYSIAYRKNEVLIFNKFSETSKSSYRFLPEEPRNPEIGSMAIFPISDDQGNCRLLISIENKNICSFSGELKQILSTLAQNASVALAKTMLYQKAERLATTDGLTGLLNHRTFQQHLEKELKRAKRYKRPLSLLMMDIDYFKKFNDTYGHPVGDLVLKEVSRNILEAIRINDVAARYGGEEFTVILPETDRENTLPTAERIRKKIESNRIQVKNETLSVNVSIGFSNYPYHCKEKEELIKYADHALYYSKENGRNRCSEYKKNI